MIAFKDLNPVAPVHVLVVPRQHIVSINEFAEQDPAGELAIHLMNCIPKVAEACGVVESGYRLINNCGKDGGQTVPHFHIHIIGVRIWDLDCGKQKLMSINSSINTKLNLFRGIEQKRFNLNHFFV